MAIYLGDFAEDAVITFPWDSYDAAGGSVTRATDGTIYVEKVGALSSSGATAATITKANPGVVTDVGHGLENGDEVFFYNLTEMTEVNQTIQTVANKAADTFEITDTSGYGVAETTGGAWVQVNSADVTDTEDYKGVTGSHLTAIDTSADDYFAVAADYIVYILEPTIDSQTVNASLRQYSIENRFTEVDITKIHGTAITETAGQLAGAFTKFFDVATPTGTINSIPDAVAGVAGGLFIAGTNAATSITTALTTNIIGDITGTLDTVTTCTTATTVTDRVTADVTYIHGTALTETAGQLAGAFTKFFDVAAPTGTANSLPDAVAGAAGGVFIAGTNASLTVTGTTTLTGAVSLGAALDVTGTTTLADVAATTVAITGGATGLSISGTTAGLHIDGGTTGVGVDIDGGGTSGAGVTIDATSGEGIAITSAAGPGIEIDGTTYGIDCVASAGPGVLFQGTTYGISAQATGGTGIYAYGQDANGHGIFAKGDDTAGGTGRGVYIVGGSAAAGLESIGGDESGAGILASATANNDAGMELVKHGTGVDLDADFLGSFTAAQSVAIAKAGQFITNYTTQNKSTGVITVYDTDDVTPIWTSTASNETSTYEVTQLIAP